MAMRKLLYVLSVLSFCGCFAGCDGDTDEDQPVVCPEASGVNFVLKSAIAGVEDAGLKNVLKHVRLYIYDSDKKLLSAEKYGSPDSLKLQKLDAGSYWVVLVGNVTADENISSENEGTPMDNMSVNLVKKAGAANYSPVGDVLLARSNFTVSGKNTEVVLAVQRTLSSAEMDMTDYSGSVSQIGVSVPGVGTEMGFGDGKWVKPGVVFVPMAETRKAASQQNAFRAGIQPKNYHVLVNISVIAEGGGAQPKVQWNIVATDTEGAIVLAQKLDVPFETKPNAGFFLNLELKAGGGAGNIEISVKDFSVRDDKGKTEEGDAGDVKLQDGEVEIVLRPGDWVVGNDENIDIGGEGEDEEDPKDGTVIPDGDLQEWEDGGDEEVEIVEK